MERKDDTPPHAVILFLSADPTTESRLRLGEELREIQEKLQLSRLREMFKIEQRIDIIVNKPIDQKVVELSSSQRYSLVENSMYHAVFLLKAYKMTFSYNQVKERPKLFLAMTGLTHAEFEQLLPHFQGALDQYVQDNYIDRDKRQRQYGGGKPESTLITIEDKLLFILYYVKVYPLQEILAFEFDMVQSTANEWIHILRGV